LPTGPANGTRLTSHDQRPTTAYSVFGNLCCARHYFTARGQEGRCPLDAELSLPAHGYADLLREWAVYGTTDESYRECQTVLERILGVSLSLQALETGVAEAGVRRNQAMAGVFTDPASLTPECLNGTLERRGLKGASVSGIRQRARVNGLFSVRAFYDVSYVGSVPEEAPKRLILKLSLPHSEPSQRMIRQEVEFYRSYGDIAALPLVHYFDAFYAEKAGTSHLLLENLYPR
jgi:hypothetical protein